MRKTLSRFVAGFVALALLGLLLTKRISDWLLSERFESPHFVVYSRTSDAKLGRDVAQVLERDYGRLAARYRTGLREPVRVHVYTSQQLYNMAFGNPFPIPRAPDGYTGQSTGNDVYVLVPAIWQPLPDAAFPPERTRTLCTHEMAHSFVHQLNPNVTGWITEGVSIYEQTVYFDDSIRRVGFTGWIGEDVKRDGIPRFSQLFDGTRKITDRSITKDYVFAGTFIDFAVTRYGYPALGELIRSYDFVRSFGKSEDEIWREWTAYLKQKYV